MVAQNLRRELRIERREIGLSQDLVAVDDRLDRPLLAFVEPVADLFVPVEPIREEAACRRRDSGPALLAPTDDFTLEGGGERQLGDVLDLPLEVLDCRRPRYG